MHAQKYICMEEGVLARHEAKERPKNEQAREGPGRSQLEKPDSSC